LKFSCWTNSGKLYTVHVYYEWLICVLNDCTGAVT
jgi:hypothetical protein